MLEIVAVCSRLKSLDTLKTKALSCQAMSRQSKQNQPCLPLFRSLIRAYTRLTRRVKRTVHVSSPLGWFSHGGSHLARVILYF